MHDRASPAFGDEDAGLGQDRQMIRHRIMRNAEPPRDLTGGKAARLGTDDHSERREPCGLRQGRHHLDGCGAIHMSTISDVSQRLHQQDGSNTFLDRAIDLRYQYIF